MKTPTPKAVVFDLGKVLLDFDYTRALQRLLPHMSCSLAEITRLWSDTPLLLDYESGRLSTPEFIARVRESTGYRGTDEAFAEAFGDIFTEIAPMVALAEGLRTRGVPRYIFSNTNELAIRFIRRRFAFFGHFDGYVYSYEHGAMKPQAALYEVVENLSGLRAGDLFYLDDRPENVAAGQARGWQALVHEQSERSRAALATWGLAD